MRNRKCCKCNGHGFYDARVVKDGPWIRKECDACKSTGKIQERTEKRVS